jgi:large subunit ribosomal protein L24
MAMRKQNIMKNDEVYVLSGKDKGRTGKVLSADPGAQKVTVEGINLAKKHQKPRRQGASGEVIDVPMPIHVSNLRLICPHCKEPIKPKRKLVSGSKKRQRSCPECDKYIERPK